MIKRANRGFVNRQDYDFCHGKRCLMAPFFYAIFEVVYEMTQELTQYKA